MQLQLGSARVAFDASHLASLVDGHSSFASNTRKAAFELSEIFQIIRLFSEKALVVDMESRAPIVLVALAGREEDLSKEIKYNWNASPVRKPDHRALMDHLNYEYWFVTLTAVMPKLVTICARTSKVTMEFLSASALKSIVLSKAQMRAEKAAFGYSGNRRPKNLSSTGFGKSKMDRGSLVKALYDIKRFGLREGKMEELADGRMKVEIAALEMVVSKANEGIIPLVILEAFGNKFSIPMDDETLCHALALLLAKIAPAYI